jgi:hypothetical protein
MSHGVPPLESENKWIYYIRFELRVSLKNPEQIVSAPVLLFFFFSYFPE